MIIKKRAEMLRATREFFYSKDIIEVDTPALSPFANIDTYIDPIKTCSGYLHTSPEYGMKKLLAEGHSNIYQLSHVYRKEEIGSLHRTEFMMVEWYRNLPFEKMIQETIEFIKIFIPTAIVEIETYEELLTKHAGITSDATKSEILHCIEKHNIPASPGDCINYIWASLVEPHLGKQKLTVVKDYPKTMSALAEIQNGVAKRFEIYYDGIELANGYLELRCPKEQLKRFEITNLERVDLGKEALPLDPSFMQALEQGFGACCGVACGFDRLLMLHIGEKDIQSVLYS